ncbi:MAG: trypsin-like peptidase domain-containing protein [Pirellulales bacterium]
MSNPVPRNQVAGEREAGVPCAHCGVPIQLGYSTAVCRDCGALHHDTCWQLKPRCGSYECSTSASAADANAVPALTISRADLAAAQPLPARSAAEGSQYRNASGIDSSGRWNRAGVWAFVVALLGIPLFGLITGLVAIVIACIALAGHVRNQRGLGLAVGAIVLGLGEVIGWAVGLSYFMGMPQQLVSLEQLTIDPESLKELPERLVRALRANVVIQSAAGLGRQGLGSGVVVSIRDGLAYIVTNRHVVDHQYTDATTTVPRDLDSLGKIEITTVDQGTLPGKVEWIAPHGVDLAIVSAPVVGDDLREAHWDRAVVPHIGDSVFAIGNPHGLGWTHSAGDISQVRRRSQGGFEFRILQTTAAINPGNSGGGLYDADGRLIGINTLTGDKRFAEGLGFSIALPTLLELVPERLRLPDHSPEQASAEKKNSEKKISDEQAAEKSSVEKSSAAEAPQ